MSINDNIPADVRDEVIELGVASIETKGIFTPLNEANGQMVPPGIAE